MSRLNLHALLVAALKAAASDSLTGPWHGGIAVTPKIGTFGALGVALMCADAARGHLREADVKPFEVFVGLARNVYDKHLRGEVGREPRTFPAKFYGLNTPGKAHVWCLTRDQLLALRELVSTARYEYGFREELAPALAIGHAAALQAYFVESATGEHLHVRRAVETVIALLADKPADVRRFVHDLDAVILREEVRAMLRGIDGAVAARVTAGLWRGIEGGKTTLFLGRLDGLEHVLVFKHRGRFRAFVGPRDEVLASVPDAHMESAVNTVRR